MPPHQPILRTLIADDEPVARQGIQRLVQQTPFLRLAGQARHSSELTEFLSRSPVDLLFLDIQMPGDSGIDWLRSHPDPPLVIFTTAWAKFAVEGFELNAVDFLLKPVTAERFSRAAEKALELFTLRLTRSGVDDADTGPPFLFVKADRQQRKVVLADILFIEGLLNYVIIHTEKQRIITYTSMKNMLSSLPAAQFLRVHKSYIIALDKIGNIGKEGVRIRQHQLPVSRRYRPALETWLGGRQLS